MPKTEKVVKETNINSKGKSNIDNPLLSTSRVNYTSYSKSLETDTIEEIRIDLELVKNSAIMHTDDNALLYSNSNRSNILTERQNPISERNIFQNNQVEKIAVFNEYNSENLKFQPDKTKKKIGFKKPPTDTSRSNSRKLNESNLLEKADKILSLDSTKNYNTLEKEFLDMSINEKKKKKVLWKN